MDTLVALSRILQVSTDYLLTGTPTQQESAALNQMFLSRMDAADKRLAARKERPFTRQELATLFAALLLEP